MAGLFKINSDSPAVHWSVVKTFFKWAFSTDLSRDESFSKTDVASVSVGTKSCPFLVTSLIES